jgi:undecaprenyl-diphosphatase
MTYTEDDDHHHFHMFTDHRWAVGGAIALFAAAAALFIVMAFDAGRDFIQPLDDAWLDAMVAIESGPLTILSKTLDILGGALVTWPLRIILTVYLAVQRRWIALSVWLVTAVVAEASVGLLKEAYQRPRPLDPLVETTGFSFPSGHALIAAATAVALVVVFVKPGPHRRIWEVRAALFALVMALSRTYLRAHWLTDVIAGVLLGAAIAIAVAAVSQTWRSRRAGVHLSPAHAKRAPQESA